MGDFATASGHWYKPDGEPAYTIKGANGAMRATTLRDARKLGLLPSVTTIIRCAAAPGLEQWKRNQLLLAALTLPRRENELEVDWLRRVEQDSQETGRKAADKGTAIHAAIEQHYRGQAPEQDYWDHVKVSAAALLDRCGEQAWHAERSFAFGGYAGKTDLHSDAWVIDVKTKDGDGPHELYDEHLMQACRLSPWAGHRRPRRDSVRRPGDSDRDHGGGDRGAACKRSGDVRRAAGVLAGQDGIRAVNKLFIIHGQAQVDSVGGFIRSNWAAAVKNGKPLAVHVTESKAKRTLDQNARLHAMLQDIAEQAWFDGRQFDSEVWKEWARREFIGSEEVELPGGKRIERGISTTKLDVEQFGKLMDRLEAHAATEFGVQFRSI